MLSIYKLKNKILERIKNEFLAFLKVNYKVELEHPYKTRIDHIFLKSAERKGFRNKLKEVYGFNRVFENDCKLHRIYAGLYQKDIENYFSSNDLNFDYLCSLDLFKPFFKNPKNHIQNHIKTAIKKGDIQYACDYKDFSYCAIEYYATSDMALNTTVIIQGKKYHGEYKVVSVFPGCYRGPYFYLENLSRTDISSSFFNASFQSKTDELYSEPFSFYDPYFIFEHKKFKNEFKDRNYCVYGLILEADVDENNRKGLIEISTDKHWRDFDNLYAPVDFGELLEESNYKNAVYELNVPFEEPVQYQYMGKTFYKFDYDPTEIFGLESGRGKIPFFMSSLALPKETKLYKEDRLNVKVIMIAHHAGEDADLDYFKFGCCLGMFQPKIPSREEECRSKKFFVIPEGNKYCTGFIYEYARFDEYIDESCQLFKRKYGFYPNILKINNSTVQKIFTSLDEWSKLDENFEWKEESDGDNMGTFFGGDEQNLLCFGTNEYKLYVSDDSYLDDGYFVVFFATFPGDGESVDESENLEEIYIRIAA